MEEDRELAAIRFYRDEHGIGGLLIITQAIDKIVEHLSLSPDQSGRIAELEKMKVTVLNAMYVHCMELSDEAAKAT